MEEFVLIMRHEDGKKVASPEQMQIWMKQTMDWIGSIAAQNKFSSGIGLPFEDAKVVRPNNIVTNGPFGDIKETIGGYIIVKANSVDEAALNRTYALSKANSKREAITEAEKLQLTDNHYYYTLLGELYRGIDNEKAKQNFQKAISLARTQTDKQTISKKLDDLC